MTSPCAPAAPDIVLYRVKSDMTVWQLMGHFGFGDREGHVKASCSLMIDGLAEPSSTGTLLDCHVIGHSWQNPSDARVPVMSMLQACIWRPARARWRPSNFYSSSNATSPSKTGTDVRVRQALRPIPNPDDRARPLAALAPYA